MRGALLEMEHALAAHIYEGNRVSAYFVYKCYRFSQYPCYLIESAIFKNTTHQWFQLFNYSVMKLEPFLCLCLAGLF
jgi:hypothetical protein